MGDHKCFIVGGFLVAVLILTSYHVYNVFYTDGDRFEAFWGAV